jgi:predicted aspartyl protease
MITQGLSNVNDFCRPTAPLFLNLKPVEKPTFKIEVLADTGATRSLISLSTATKHGCKIKETTICISAANGAKIDVLGTTSLQVVERGQRVHTIVAVVSQNVDQTIVGWKDLMAMGVIS